MNDCNDLSVFVGKTIKKIIHFKTGSGSDELVFVFNSGEIICFNHQQDCCESVYIESINGNLSDLLNSPLTLSRSASSKRSDESEFNSFLMENDIKIADLNSTNADDSETWTFYTFATIKGYVDLRWYGTSNGYYSEEVSCFFIRDLEEYVGTFNGQISIFNEYV